MKKIAVIIFGEPGSGKTTQAKLLANYYNIIHFDTGRFLENILFDSKNKNKKIFQKEKRIFKSGKLNTPSFVVSEVKKQILKIHQAGFGIIFSGSPRTLYEAEKEIPLLQKLYGKKNIFFIELKLEESEALKRNSKRLICKFCGYTLLSAYFKYKNIKSCPVCGGRLYKRVLDNPKIISIRFQEYKNRTIPIFNFIKQKGFRIFEIDAKPRPYKIFQKIAEIINTDD